MAIVHVLVLCIFLLVGSSSCVGAASISINVTLATAAFVVGAANVVAIFSFSIGVTLATAAILFRCSIVGKGSFFSLRLLLLHRLLVFLIVLPLPTTGRRLVLSSISLRKDCEGRLLGHLDVDGLV